MDSVAVIGLGKLGLPVATQFALSGLRVTGVDINRSVVEDVNHGREPFPGESELDSHLKTVVLNGSLSATTNLYEAVGTSEVIVIAVPVVIDSDLEPDFDALDSVVAGIGESIKPGTLVILETTVPVGTTRNRLAASIETESGLRAGIDFFAAFSPERVLTGRVFADLRRYPKIVGGIGAESTRRAVEFYSRALNFDERPELSRKNGAWDVGSCESAELVKLTETTYRDVNIALANIFAQYAESIGIDIAPVIAAANSQSYSHIHQPGIAVGGHCIPVYPHLYLSGDPSAELVRVARETNTGIPKHAVKKVEEALGGLHGKRVLVLGASYRGGVKETAFSGVWDVIAAVVRSGGEAVVQDPMYSPSELITLGMAPYLPQMKVDGIIVQADHVEFRELNASDFEGVRVIFDGRRVLDPKNFPDVKLMVIGDGRLSSE